MRLGAVGDIIAEWRGGRVPLRGKAFRSGGVEGREPLGEGGERGGIHALQYGVQFAYAQGPVLFEKGAAAQTQPQFHFAPASVGLGARRTSPIASIRSQSLLTEGAREPRASPSARRLVPSCFSITSRARSWEGDTVPEAADS